MDGIFGWQGNQEAHQDIVDKMACAAKLNSSGDLQRYSSVLLGAAADSQFGKSHIHIENDLAVAFTGRPVFLDEELASLAYQKNPAAAVSLGWKRFAEKLPTHMRGNFAFAVLEPKKKQACLVLDRVGIERLCYAYHAGQLVFGSSLQGVAAHPAVSRDFPCANDTLFKCSTTRRGKLF